MTGFTSTVRNVCGAAGDCLLDVEARCGQPQALVLAYCVRKRARAQAAKSMSRLRSKKRASLSRCPNAPRGAKRTPALKNHQTRAALRVKARTHTRSLLFLDASSKVGRAVAVSRLLACIVSSGAVSSCEPQHQSKFLRQWQRRMPQEGGFFLSCNPIQSIVADPCTDLDCLIPQTARPVDCRALSTTETIYNVVQNWPDSVGDLFSAADAVVDARRPAPLPIPPSSFSIARK